VSDQVTRSAARLAALIAIPIALLAGVGAFALLGGAFEDAADPPAGRSGPTGPVATGPVELPARELTGEQATACRALLSRLPDQLDGQPQRPVTEGAEQNAAYGDPPVTLACGVPEAAYAPTDFLTSHDGVCWHSAVAPPGTVWTTLDRRVPVQVTVPAAYDGPGQQVVEFTAAIRQSIAATDTVPAGCAP
jgi:hypothetical protein